MEKVVKKWFFPWNYDIQEAWLNNMARSGWLLEHAAWGKYLFRVAGADEYAIRVELMESLPESGKGREYIGFITDTGAQYIGSRGYWAYFCKRKSEGPFALFSDLDSRIRYLNRFLFWFGVPAGLALYMCLYGFLMGGMDYSHWPTIVGYALNGVLFLLLAYAFLRVYFKRSALKKERALRE